MSTDLISTVDTGDNNSVVMAMQKVELEERMFELAQRQAKVYSTSELVPKAYRGKVGNVLIAQNMANRMGADLLQVMQNLYVVNGTPGWSSQFLIATFNKCGRFSSIKYRFFGEEGSKDWGCVAYCKEKSTGETIEGPRITLEMAQKEGWSTKAGSKWRTMPELMIRYRSAAFLIRTTAPEIGMGLHTKEELEEKESNQQLSHSVGNGSFSDVLSEIEQAEADAGVFDSAEEEVEEPSFENEDSTELFGDNEDTEVDEES